MVEAVIDMGTNTFLLLIGTYENKQLSIVEKQEVPVMIGAGGMQAKRLQEEALERAYACLHFFKVRMESYAIQRVQAFATSAIRNAVNGNDYCLEVFNRFGIHIQTLDGNSEAEAIFNGAMRAVGFISDLHLVMDIGGGSVECIIGSKDGIVWKRSFETGTSRLLERFPISDPMELSERALIMSYLHSEWQSLMDAIQKWKPIRCIGTAGAFDTIYAIETIRNHKSYVHIEPAAYLMPAEDMHDLIHQICSMTVIERSALPGMPSFRVPMMPYAMLLIQQICNALPHCDWILSEYALKEGLIS